MCGERWERRKAIVGVHAIGSHAVQIEADDCSYLTFTEGI